MFPYSQGVDFDVKSPILVFSLGVFDSSQDGIVGTLSAQLFDRSTQLPITAALSFSSSTPGTLMNGSRFESLSSPLDLGVGQYSIVAWGFGGNDLSGDSTHVGAGSADCFGSNPFDLSTLDDGGGVISFVVGVEKDEAPAQDAQQWFEKRDLPHRVFQLDVREGDALRAMVAEVGE